MNYKVGDTIVEYGQVYEIFKITERESYEGTGIERVIHFKPIYESQQNKSMTCSIPIRSIKDTHIRPPLNREDITKLLEVWVKKPNIQTPADKNHATEILNKNNPRKTIRLLKCLWIEKTDDTTNYTKSKKDMFELAMTRFVEEVAYVLSIPLKDAEDQIIESLRKNSIGEKVVEA